MTNRISAQLVLTPEGHVYLDQSAQALEHLPEQVLAKLAEGFARSSTHGLVQLAIGQLTDLPPSFAFWQGFGQQLIAAICKLSNLNQLVALPEIAPAEEDALQDILEKDAFLFFRQ